MKKRFLPVFLVLIMVLSALPGTVFGVTGDQIAKDGTYQSAITATHTKKTKTKSGTVSISVAGGKISNITFGGDDAKDFKKYLMGEKGTTAYKYMGIEASADAVDAVSSATVSDAKYNIDLKSAIKQALSYAEAVESDPETGTKLELSDGSYTSDYNIDSGKYKGTVTVTVEQGRITDITVDGSGDFSNPLKNAKENLLDRDITDDTDAITSATKYSQGLEDAIMAAVKKAMDGNGGSSGDSGNTGEGGSDNGGSGNAGDSQSQDGNAAVSIAPGETVEIYVGEKVILNGTSSTVGIDSDAKWTADNDIVTFGLVDSQMNVVSVVGKTPGTTVITFSWPVNELFKSFGYDDVNDTFTVIVKEKQDTGDDSGNTGDKDNSGDDTGDNTGNIDDNSGVNTGNNTGSKDDSNPTVQPSKPQPSAKCSTHTWDKGVVTKKATLTAAGVRTHTCTKCGAKKTASIPKVKLGTPKIGTAAKKNGKMNVSWKKVAGASGYIVSWKKVGASKWSTKKVTKQSVNLTGMKTGAIYQYRVAATKKATSTSAAATGNYSTISYRYYRSLSGQKYVAGKKSIKVSWKKDKGATGYQVLVASNKKLTGAKVYTVRGSGKTGYTVKGLKKGKTYYMACRPVKKSGGKTYIGIRRTYGKAVKVK